MADFKFFLNRQGPKGEPGAKGEKGDNGNTPIFSDGINTPTVYTMQIDMGDGNVFETQNLKYPMRDDGGNYLRYDRTNSTVTLSAPNIADLQRTSGEVTLASVSDVENEEAQDTDAVSMELRNADQLALSNEINRIDGNIDAVDDKVDREIQDRQDADTQLTNKINTDVGNEATTRSNVDTALSGRIDGLDSSKANKSDVYTKIQTDTLLSGKANTVHTHTLSQITNAGSLAGKNTVDYGTEVTNKPTIGDGTITITQGGVTKGTFTTNQSGDSTIALDAGGGGGAYTEGAGITIDQNNEISVNVDNDTIVIDNNLLKANIPVVPTVNDATITITQGGVTKGTFTTNQSTNATIALDAGPDMSSYYTKTQTDSLLDEKIDNDIVQYPLEYLPDTTDSITLHNINSTTLTDTRTNGYISAVSITGGWNYRVHLFDGDTNNYINLAEDANAINLPNLSYAEINLVNGFNLALNNYEHLNNYSGYIVLIFGFYSNNVFIPKMAWNNYMGDLFELSTEPNNNIQFLNGSQRDIEGIYKSQNNTTLYFSGVYDSSSGNQTNTIITQSQSDIIDECTHARIFCLGNSQSSSNCTIDLTKIKIVNPNPSVSNCASGNTSQNYNTWNDSDNIFDVHPASLSLKYDNTTLGINANNELYALSSTPSNMVTTDTEQDLSNTKYFIDDNRIWFGRSKNSSSPWRNYNIISKYGFKTEYYVNNSNYGNIEVSTYQDKPSLTVLKNGNPVTTLSDNYGHYWFNTGALDGTTITYNSSTGKISAAASPSIATSSTPGIVQPDNSTITVDSNGIISSVNNSIAKTAPVMPLEYDETEDGISTGIGGTLNHTNYTSSADEVWVYDPSVASIYTSNGGNFSQTATNMMSKIFYKGYKIRLDNGLNIAWNVAESSGFFMNVAIGYYNNETFVPVLYALNTNSYGGSMFARLASEFGSDIYDMGRLNTQFTGCVGISLVGDTLSAFSPTNGRHTYAISSTLLTEFQKCTHAICTVIMKSGSGYSFDYSTGKFVNPTATLSDDLEVRNAVFSAAENLILNDDVTVIPELKLNYDSTYFKVVNNQLTLDIQAIKDAIDALSSSSGNASLGPGLNPGGWD